MIHRCVKISDGELLINRILLTSYCGTRTNGREYDDAEIRSSMFIIDVILILPLISRNYKQLMKLMLVSE